MEIPGWLIEGLLGLLAGSNSERKQTAPAKRKPSKVVKVVIKSTNGEKHGWIEDHTKR